MEDRAANKDDAEKNAGKRSAKKNCQLRSGNVRADGAGMEDSASSLDST